MEDDCHVCRMLKALKGDPVCMYFSGMLMESLREKGMVKKHRLCDQHLRDFASVRDQLQKQFLEKIGKVGSA